MTGRSGKGFGSLVMEIDVRSQYSRSNHNSNNHSDGNGSGCHTSIVAVDISSSVFSSNWVEGSSNASPLSSAAVGGAVQIRGVDEASSDHNVFIDDDGLLIDDEESRDQSNVGYCYYDRQAVIRDVIFKHNGVSDDLMYCLNVSPLA